MSADGTQDFIKAAKALNDAGDHELRKAVYRGFRSSARPLGEAMIRGLADDMPKRGGLSARVASSRVSILNATTGRNPRVVISLRSTRGYKLGPMNDGNLRHPVFARANAKRTWVRQSVHPGGATRAFDEGAPLVRRQIIRELSRVIDDTARKG